MLTAVTPTKTLSEQGNVDDDATFITIFLVHSIYSLASSCSLQSAVCSLQSANVIHHFKLKESLGCVFIKFKA